MSEAIHDRAIKADNTRRLANWCLAMGVVSVPWIVLSHVFNLWQPPDVATTGIEHPKLPLVLNFTGVVMTIVWWIGVSFVGVNALAVFWECLRGAASWLQAGKSCLGLMAAVFILGIFILPWFIPHGPTPPTQQNKHRCIRNLRQIDGAKQQWALENRKLDADIPAASDITLFLKDNVLPTCPSGGSYTINAVSADPNCTKAGFGHTL